MITNEQLKRNLNSLRLHNEGILIDIIFGLIDIEDRLGRDVIPIEEVKERIQKIKENIGRELKD